MEGWMTKTLLELDEVWGVGEDSKKACLTLLPLEVE